MKLFDFAFVPNYPQPIEKLSQFAEPEPWGRAHRVLKSYFNHMFEKVYDDGLIVSSRDGAYAAFNTGLTNGQFEPIFAVFAKNERPDAQAWFFRGFGIQNRKGLGELLVTDFDTLPHRVRFVENLSDLLYDPRKGAPRCHWRALFLDHLKRIPRPFLEHALDGRLTIPNVVGLEREEAQARYEAFREEMETADDALDFMIGAAEVALEQAMDRVHSDYKTAVPQWHAKDRVVNLLLPLALYNPREVDAALSVRLDEHGNYVGEHLLTLEMAYNNARLIAKPEAAWLLESLKTNRRATQVVRNGGGSRTERGSEKTSFADSRRSSEPEDSPRWHDAPSGFEDFRD
jgi:hypothetical protein